MDPMTKLKELQELAKDLAHPAEVLIDRDNLNEWNVTKVEGTPNQYELTYGEDSQKFYYLPNTTMDAYGPRTALSIARYLLLKGTYESTPPNTIIDTVMSLGEKFMGKK